VVCTMRQYACRRVPVTENGNPVGLVTLDDLILDDPVDVAAGRSVVRAQLQMPARLKPEGELFPRKRDGSAQSARRRSEQRHAARAEATYQRLLLAVESRGRLGTRDRAEAALEVVLRMLCQRLRPEDGTHLVAHLPSALQTDLSRHLVGPRKELTT